MPAYRQSHGDNFVWVGIVLGGLIVGLAVTLVLSRFSDSPWLFVVMLLPFLVGLALAVWRMRARNRARTAAIQAMLEADGFVVDLAPAGERAEAVFAPVRHVQDVLDLRHGAERIEWLALHAPSTLIFEHEHVTGSGRSTTIHSCTVIAISAAHQTLRRASMGTAPFVSSERAAFLRGRYLRSRLATVQVGDVAFDRAWITIGDATTAQSFFTRRVRDILVSSPRGEVWCVGHGFVCCAYRGALSGEHLARMLNRMRSVLADG